MLVGTFEETLEACTADAEHAGGTDTVAIAGRQDAPDLDAAQFAGELVESAHQMPEVARLVEKTARFVLDGVDCGFNRVNSGHQQHGQGGIFLQGFAEERDTAQTWKLAID